MALTGSIQANEARGTTREYPVAAGAKIYGGSAVALNASGLAVEPSAATGLTSVGVADVTVDNTAGGAGAVTVRVRPGIYGRKNSTGADLIAQADVGSTVYFVDGGTVAKVATGRSAAGKVSFIENGLVYVQLGEWQFVTGC